MYDERWAHSVQDEAHATKQLIDYFAERRQQYPGMHVYHYNHTERSSLERLAIEHGVGEAKLAELVEAGLFVDLLTVVTNAMQVGVESYGLKHIELLAVRTQPDIDQGAGAVVGYDAYCHDGEASRLTRIAATTRTTCTRRLRCATGCSPNALTTCPGEQQSSSKRSPRTPTSTLRSKHYICSPPTQLSTCWAICSATGYWKPRRVPGA